MDNSLIRSHLESAAGYLACAMQDAVPAPGRDDDCLLGVSHSADFAAEFTGKAAMVHLGIDPERGLSLSELADQLEREKPDDPRAAGWAAPMRSIYRLSADCHRGVCVQKPRELPDWPPEILGMATAFFAAVLRDITETRDSFAPHAAAVASVTERRLLNMHELRCGKEVPEVMRGWMDAWKEEVQGIARRAHARTQQPAPDTGDLDESPGTGL